MNKSRFDQHDEGEARAGQSHAPAGVEFASPEEMLRHDAAETRPPPELAVRLNESIAKEPKPPASWWSRLTGKK